MKGAWGWMHIKLRKPCPKCEHPVTERHIRKIRTSPKIQAGSYCSNCGYEWK